MEEEEKEKEEEEEEEGVGMEGLGQAPLCYISYIYTYTIYHRDIYFVKGMRPQEVPDT
jgi:hypothetical protein